jgi:hypothetical protein
MNTPSPESPRFVCRVVRWWVALTEFSVPTTASGHRANCPACRAYFQSTAALEAQLRHDSRAQMAAVPAGLEHRIADAVRRAQVPARTPQRRSGPIWATGLVTVAAAVALVVVLNRGSRPSRATTEVGPAEIAAVFTAVTALPQHFNDVFVPASSRPANADPLRRELDNVKADARSALSFLAENFLPAARPDPTSTIHDRQPALQGS